VRIGIAKDLHDEIGSTLTSINILSRASASGLADDQHKSLEMMNTVSEQSQQMQQSMSDIVWAINPANDKVENILVRMREYIARTLEPLNINVGFKVTRETEKNVLSMNERKDLLYVFKEAINNISKHAQCRNVNIELNKDKEATVLTITDDGLGFDPEMVTSSSGIKNMKNRIGLLGGNISITSEANKGTIITIRIPAGQDATS
jgi:signal transduction histidine kinase